LSTLADLTAAGRSDVLPGYVLSPPRLREWGDAETEAAASYIRAVRQSCLGLPAEVSVALMQQALDLVASGEFGMGMPKLDAYLRSATAAPFALWLCLRVKHPQVTRDAVDEVTASASEEDVARAVLELWGFLPTGGAKKKTVSESSNQSTGGESSKPSEPSADSRETPSST
jgi:hypothetical protein